MTDTKKTADRGKPVDKESEAKSEPSTQNTFGKNEAGEIGGPKGPEPTRFGDWEQKGRCSDF